MFLAQETGPGLSGPRPPFATAMTATTAGPHFICLGSPSIISIAGSFHPFERMQMDAAGAPAETHAFQAEVAELLNLMVHSVYSETDIFLRELISIASDACDKLRYEAIAKPELLAGADKLAIRIVPDK